MLMLPTALEVALQEVGRMALFSLRVARRGFFQMPNWPSVWEEVVRVGWRGLPVLVAVSVFIGSNLAIQGYHAFKPLGGQSLVGMFVAVAGIREFAPLIATTIIAARTGTEMTTTLAMMRITEQIDALEVMGVNPYWYLVAPRIIAITVMLPILTLLANALCFATGLLVAVYQLNLDLGTYLDTATQYVSLRDLRFGVYKSSVFGVIISALACYHGFHTEPGPLGVGRAANKAVVMMAVSCTLMNFFLSEVLYG